MAKSKNVPAGCDPNEFEGHTPLMRQYLTFKKKVGDALLFFRVGDFYEIFLDDAVRASKLLDIALTKRGQTNGEPCAMAGVPWMSLEVHLAKLSRKGVAAAVVDQIGDPATSKGPVERALTKIVTPGTLLDEALLEERKDSALMAVWPLGREKSAFAVVSMTLAAGECEWFVCPAGDLADEANRIAPAEILAPESFGFEWNGKRATSLPDWRFSQERGKHEIMEHFGCVEIEPFGLSAEFEPLALPALCAAWTYAKTTLGGKRPPIEKLRMRLRSERCAVDADTRRALEIHETGGGLKTGSLIDALDHAVSPMGSRALRNWINDPYAEPAVPSLRLDAIDSLLSCRAALDSLREALRGFPDAERAGARLSALSSRPRDFVTIRRSLELIPGIRQILSKFPACALLDELSADLQAPSGLLEFICSAVADEPPVYLRDGGFAKAGYSPELDALRDLCDGAEQAMRAIEERERALTGIATLRVDFNRATGFTIEVSKAQSANAPERWKRRQTLKNNERYVTDELLELETRVLAARAKILAAEKDLFDQIVQKASGWAKPLMNCAKALASLDALSCNAWLSAERSYCRPEFSADGSFCASGMRHPAAELLCPGEFVPNDLQFGGPGAKTLVVTGPNMGGKSTLMRSAAMLCLLAGAGLRVPAQRARVPLPDAIRARAGASDDTGKNRSTFMTEMAEAGQILRQSTPKTFCIIDEIGRGTSTHDGMSLAWACLRHLTEVNRCLTLFSTHYFEIAEMAEHLDGCLNYHLEALAENGKAVFLRKLRPGMAKASMGLEVARMAGLPEQALLWAKHAHDKLSSEQAQNPPPPGPAAQAEPPASRAPADPGLVEFLAALGALDTDEMTPKQALMALSGLASKAGEWVRKIGN